MRSKPGLSVVAAAVLAAGCGSGDINIDPVTSVSNNTMNTGGGRNGAPGGFEQLFESLAFTWSWYPSDTITIKAKAQNLLQEQIEIERAGVVTFAEDPGSSYSLSFSWAL